MAIPVTSIVVGVFIVFLGLLASRADGVSRSDRLNRRLTIGTFVGFGLVFVLLGVLGIILR